MKIKQTLLTVALAVGVTTGVVTYTEPAYANHTPSHADYQDAQASQMCGDVKTSIIGGDVCGNVVKDSTDIKQSGVWALLILVLNILTAGVGIAAVGGIAYGAALYASSADKPEQAKAGMTFIKNVVIGLIAYALMFIILNFLIPGGLFS